MRAWLGLWMLFALPLADVAGALGREHDTPGVRIRVVPEYPIRGETAELRVETTPHMAEGARVIVTYRPNSKVERTEVLTEHLSRRGLLAWVPSDEGIVMIHFEQTIRDSAGDLVVDRRNGESRTLVAATTCAVRFNGTPWSGVVVFSIASFVLLGGAAATLWVGGTQSRTVAAPARAGSTPPS